MDTYSWIVLGLAAFDLLVVALIFLLIRSNAFVDRRGRMTTAIALSGFVFHAILFFEGTILYMQLATLAVIYFTLSLVPSRLQSSENVR